MRFIKKHIIVILFIILDILLVGKNFIQPGVFAQGDLTHPVDIQNYINYFLYLFNDATSVSGIENIDRALILLPLSYFFKFVGITETKYLIATLFFVLLFLSQISFYVLLKNTFSVSGKIALFFASVFYSLSPWVVEVFPAPLFWLAYALMPLFITYSIKFFNESKWFKNTVILAIILSAIASTPQYLIFSGVIFFLIGIYFLVTQRGFADKNLPKILVFGLMFLILNFYWLYPIMNIFSQAGAVTPGYGEDSYLVDLFSRNISPLKLFQGLEQWVYWYQNDPFFKILENPIWIISSLVPLAVTIAVFLTKMHKKHKYTGLLVGLFSFFFIFSLGSLFPFYKWLVYESPVKDFGWLFRVPGKFSFMIWIFFAVSIAIFFNGFNRKTWQKIVLFFTAGLLVFFIFPKSYRYLTFYYSPVEYPSVYDQLYNYLENDNDYKSLFLAPYHYGINANNLGYETSYNWNPDRLASVSPAASVKGSSVAYYHLTYRNWQSSLYQKIYPEFTELDPNENIPQDIGENYLAKANVKYLVFHNDIVGAQEKGKETAEILKNKTDLEFVGRFGDFIYLFKNPFVRPVLYFADPDKKIIIRKTNPTKYQFDANLDQPSYLYFAQTFDPFWRLTVDGKIIKPEKAFNFGLIKYKIEKTGGVTGEINYYPQKYYQTGLKISFLFFGLCAVYLIYIFFYNRRMEEWKKYNF